MILYLWDACRARGVTDSRSRALELAEACLLSGRADSARIEEARAMLGVTELTSGYHRLGRGWLGRLCEGEIFWEPFAELAAS